MSAKPTIEMSRVGKTDRGGGFINGAAFGQCLRRQSVTGGIPKLADGLAGFHFDAAGEVIFIVAEFSGDLCDGEPGTFGSGQGPGEARGKGVPRALAREGVGRGEGGEEEAEDLEAKPGGFGAVRQVRRLAESGEAVKEFAEAVERTGRGTGEDWKKAREGALSGEAEGRTGRGPAETVGEAGRCGHEAARADRSCVAAEIHLAATTEVEEDLGIAVVMGPDFVRELQVAVEFESPESDLAVEKVQFGKKKRAKMEPGKTIGKGVMRGGAWHVRTGSGPKGIGFGPDEAAGLGTE